MLGVKTNRGNLFFLFGLLVLILAFTELTLGSEIPPPEAWTERGIVLEHGPPGKWDAFEHYVRVTSVVKKDGTYFLYYSGASGPRYDGPYEPANRAIGVATSTDGINFTKYSGNPIVTHQPSKGHPNQVEEGAAFGIVKLDDNDDFVMFWEGITATGTTTVSGDIHVSTSSDGFNFTDQGVVYPCTAVPGEGDEVWPIGVLHAQGGTSVLSGQWHVWFSAEQYSYRAGLATGNTPLNLKLQPSSPIFTDDIVRWAWPVLYPNGAVSIFEVSGGWSSDHIKVRDTSVETLDVYSEPVIIFSAGINGRYTTIAIFTDLEDNVWRMYYSVNDALIRLRTAPLESSDITPPAAPIGLRMLK